MACTWSATISSPGTWHTAGDGKVDGGGLCDYAVNSSASKPGYTVRLDGPATVNLSGVYLSISAGPARGCACHRDGPDGLTIAGPESCVVCPWLLPRP